MGQFRKHRAACFISLLLKTETGTWHLCDYPNLGENPHNEGNKSLLLVAFAQICARSTDILHGNYPRSRGNLPLQRISSPTIIHENPSKSKTFAIFFYTSFQTKFTKYLRVYMAILHKNGYKIIIFMRFCMFFHVVFILKFAQIRPLARNFCDVLTKMRHFTDFKRIIAIFFARPAALFTFYS